MSTRFRLSEENPPIGTQFDL